MRNGQFYHPSRNGASQTTQCSEIPHSLPEPFYPVLQARVGEPTPPSISIRNFNKSLKDPMRGADSAQVQIRSYCGNLARKVRSTFPRSTALNQDCHKIHVFDECTISNCEGCVCMMLSSHFSCIGSRATERITGPWGNF